MTPLSQAKDAFQSLFNAIVGDERDAVRAALKQDPALATQTSRQARLEPKLTHWIYAGDSALHVAAAGYRVEIARLLLAAGAEVRAVGKHRQSQPLHYAAAGHPGSVAWNPKRQVAMIQMLLKAGADIHAQDKNGATPLHCAVRTRCAAAVRCLLELGSDATVWNKPGSTAFHLAVQNTGRGGSGAEAAKSAQREIIEAFMAQGLNPSLSDRKGKSVLQWAKSEWIKALLQG